MQLNRNGANITIMLFANIYEAVKHYFCIQSVVYQDKCKILIGLNI